MNLLNPLFLLGALATAIPILLHLIRREHARRLEFPTLMFLRRISKRIIRYQKLRHLLLLLLRVLAFLLIALAFARPYYNSSQSPAAIGRVTVGHIILIDNSMSMSFQDRWQKAKSAAADIVQNSGAGDKFAVLEFSDNTVALTQVTANSSEALDQIGKGAELSDQPTRYGQALRAAEKFAMEAGTGKRIIHLISDFQKSEWASEEKDFRLSSGTELQYVDVGSDDFSNIAIRDVRVADAGSDAGVVIKASPINFGARDRKNVAVSLFIDGKKIAEQRIDLPKGASQGVEFQAPGMIGAHPVFLEAEDPELTRDNRFYMSLESRAKTPVLAVESPAAGKRRSPSFFLSNALNVDTWSPYKLAIVSSQNLTISGELLIWNNAPGGDQSVQKRLQDFVKAGGGLAIVMNDSTQFADFNRSFGSWLPVKAAEVSPKIHGRSRSEDEYVLMTDVRMDHPIFMPFGKPHSGNFSGARFYRHAKLILGPGTEAPARFENGDPAVVTLSFGKGRVLIFASSADNESNDLCLKAVYAPLWMQMLRHLESFREKRRWLEVGDAISPQKLMMEAALLNAKGNIANEAVAVLDPNRRRLPISSGSDAVVLEKAGFYELRTMNLSNIVAVNTDPRESDLSHGNAEEMISGWISHAPAKNYQDERITAEEQDKRQHIWSLLLIAAVLLLLSELYLSNLRLKTQLDPQSSIVNRQS
jgi:hypothetical protein